MDWSTTLEPAMCMTVITTNHTMVYEALVITSC